MISEPQFGARVLEAARAYFKARHVKASDLVMRQLAEELLERVPPAYEKINRQDRLLEQCGVDRVIRRRCAVYVAFQTGVASGRAARRALGIPGNR
jgi:hypothetical protein